MTLQRITVWVQCAVCGCKEEITVTDNSPTTTNNIDQLASTKLYIRGWQNRTGHRDSWVCRDCHGFLDKSEVIG